MNKMLVSTTMNQMQQQIGKKKKKEKKHGNKAQPLSAVHIHSGPAMFWLQLRLASPWRQNPVNARAENSLGEAARAYSQVRRAPDQHGTDRPEDASRRSYFQSPLFLKAFRTVTEMWSVR